VSWQGQHNLLWVEVELRQPHIQDRGPRRHITLQRSSKNLPLPMVVLGGGYACGIVSSICDILQHNFRMHTVQCSISGWPTNSIELGASTCMQWTGCRSSSINHASGRQDKMEPMWRLGLQLRTVLHAVPRELSGCQPNIHVTK